MSETNQAFEVRPTFVDSPSPDSYRDDVIPACLPKQ